MMTSYLRYVLMASNKGDGGLDMSILQKSYFDSAKFNSHLSDASHNPRKLLASVKLMYSYGTN